MMKKQINVFRGAYWVLPCMLLLAGCESETSQNEPVELQISPVVATTRSAIQDATGMTNVAIYATGTDYTDVKNNNYAVYTNNSNSWVNTESNAPKIYLTNAAATIYGYYPTTQKYGADLSIPVTLLEGTTSTTIAAVENATGTGIASATGEVDCMWASKVENVSNASDKSSVTLTMNHGLSMVSFRVYKDASYQGAGQLTKFIVENAPNKKLLSKGTSPKMNITTGAITPGTAQNAKYTRTIQDGYTMATTDSNSKKFSFLVLPIDESIGNDNIRAIFTVDGADYPVDLTAPSANSGKWIAGSNHLYTVKLGGTELEITQVTVTPWTEVTGGNLEIK